MYYKIHFTNQTFLHYSKVNINLNFFCTIKRDITHKYILHITLTHKENKTGCPIVKNWILLPTMLSNFNSVLIKAKILRASNSLLT